MEFTNSSKTERNVVAPKTIEFIKRLVQDKPGIKATEIAVEATVFGLHNEEECLDIPEILELLVKTNCIREIEYIKKDMDYRIKSVYYPMTGEIIVHPLACQGDPNHAAIEFILGNFHSIIDIENITHIYLRVDGKSLARSKE